MKLLSLYETNSLVNSKKGEFHVYWGMDFEPDGLEIQNVVCTRLITGLTTSY